MSFLFGSSKYEPCMLINLPGVILICVTSLCLVLKAFDNSQFDDRLFYDRTKRKYN